MLSLFRSPHRCKLCLAALTIGLLQSLVCQSFAQQAQDGLVEKTRTVRFATYNVSLFRKQAGQLIRDLEGGKNRQAHKLAAVIQQVRPDVLLLNEFDYDTQGAAAKIFREAYLGVSHGEAKEIAYPFQFFAESNTGIPSGFDLDEDGKKSGPADCFGYGTHPGQYGMLVLSRLPIAREQIRTFQRFLWKDMPDALLPTSADDGESYYSDEKLHQFRLSSKSHWDIPIQVGDQQVHFLVCHPTPPVFDGPEDRNGKRNHDEIRLFADYIAPERSGYITDDRGKRGGLRSNALFVIAGDLNADPLDGDSFPGAAGQLLDHPLIRATPIPQSKGPLRWKAQGRNAEHRGNAAYDTADFNDSGSGNLRIDYVLPSKTLNVTGAGVYWPTQEESGHRLIDASDHRAVWIDVGVAK